MPSTFPREKRSLISGTFGAKSVPQTFLLYSSRPCCAKMHQGGKLLLSVHLPLPVIAE